MTTKKITRALVSVYDKTGLVELGKSLDSAGVEILSTGSTASTLREAGVAEPTLDGPLGALQRLVGKLADKLDEGRPRDELLEQKTRLKGLQAGLTEWLNLAAEGHVYWAERGGRKQTIVSLRSAPIDVAPALREHLFGCGVSVICTSATLALAALTAAPISLPRASTPAPAKPRN